MLYHKQFDANTAETQVIQEYKTFKSQAHVGTFLKIWVVILYSVTLYFLLPVQRNT